MRVVSFVIAICLSAVVLPSAGPRRPLGLDLYRPNAEDNPLTPTKIDLGRRLFHERRLSRDRSMACASCHDPKRAFTNASTTATGVAGTRGIRNVPTIVNRAWGRSFFWDGRAQTLEAQVLQPILDPGELAMTAEQVVALARAPVYRSRFHDAFDEAPSPQTVARDAASGTALAPPFGAQFESSSMRQQTAAFTYHVEDPYKGLPSGDARTLRQVAFALAAYVRTIQSGNSPYDRHLDGDHAALTTSAVRGLAIFRGKGGCSGCHIGPLLSDERFHNTGIAWRSGSLTDEGRARVTGVISDRGAFKTPTLREVGRTAPYMHDGSFTSLEAVVDYYDDGGAPNPGLDPQLRRLRLEEDEKRALVSFLRALSGQVSDRQ